MSSSKQQPREYGNFIALIVVLLVYGWSIYTIVSYRAKQAPPEAIVIRLGHWQLEASVREAIDEMAREYRENINPNVYLIQDAIPEGTYSQWISTQLMGGTAPDILQVGAHLPENIWISYYNRYFLPLSHYVHMPNPHNADNELATVALRQTFKDGMKTAYVTELQEYMSVPLSQFGVRIFYNKNLLKELTGLDVAPLDYREFLAVCKTIASQTNSAGEYYTAIAGSQYHFGHWDSMMFSPVTYGGIRRADFNRDGFVGNDETFVAFMTGMVDFYFPPYAAWLKMLREVTDFFQPGYTGLGRDEAVFLFAQQRAVFMTTGTWDARSLQQQAEGKFEIGIMDFPLPSADDPVYGNVVEGRIYESPGAGFRFAISRNTKNFDVALDFLLYIASQAGNEKLNKIIGWIPSVLGTEVDPLLQAFEPHLEGVYGAIALSLGGNTAIKWTQLYSDYQVNMADLNDVARIFTPYYLNEGLKDFQEQQRDWRRSMHNNEQYLAGIRAMALMLPEGDEAQSAWIRYRAITSGRQIWSELNHSRQMKLVNDAVAFRATAPTNAFGAVDMPDQIGPYEYSDVVLEKIRARLRAQAALEKSMPDIDPSRLSEATVEAMTRAEADFQKAKLLDETAEKLEQIDQAQQEHAETLLNIIADLPATLEEATQKGYVEPLEGTTP